MQRMNWGEGQSPEVQSWALAVGQVIDDGDLICGSVVWREGNGSEVEVDNSTDWQEMGNEGDGWMVLFIIR